MTDPVPSVDELDALPTDDLRRRAFDQAESRRDVGFFWDLLTHLRGSNEFAGEDGSAGHIGESIADLVEMARGMLGNGYGSLEPLIRARFIDYLRS